jgi:acetyl/propionyl-CoA carboxylase alpha subunit
MSLYTVTIENRIYQVQIIGDRCTVDGQPVDDSFLSRHGNGLHVLRHENQILEMFLSEHGADTYQLLLRGGRRIVSHIVDSARRRLRASAAEDQNRVLKAPMHGLVVDVLAEPGRTVETGQVLVLLESMKMQMQLCAARAATVAAVHATAGQQVKKGAALVDFEE